MFSVCLRQAGIVVASALAAGLPCTTAAAVADLPTGSFGFEFGVTLPGTPTEIYDTVTGDISAWWDHTMSEHPARLEIEPRPGGGFWEIFDASGDGVRHAVVTYAKRGEVLRFEGPLGLTGHALQMVTTYHLAAVGADSTLLTLEVKAAGEADPRWPALVEQTWRHFIFERLQPYVAAGGRAGGR
jgi:hypothetical protein